MNRCLCNLLDLVKIHNLQYFSSVFSLFLFLTLSLEPKTSCAAVAGPLCCINHPPWEIDSLINLKRVACIDVLLELHNRGDWKMERKGQGRGGPQPRPPTPSLDPLWIGIGRASARSLPRLATSTSASPARTSFPGAAL
uniref:Uncharacterized protein n=1 Tax=Aegilops tauschii subsp. strangulata TaxID=200361 RepID=A0A453CI16_AEGTS